MIATFDYHLSEWLNWRKAPDLKSGTSETLPVRIRSPTPIWGFGVIGNIKDSDSLVLGSRPKGPAKMASSYNGSIGDFESFGVGPIPALAAKM